MVGRDIRMRAETIGFKRRGYRDRLDAMIYGKTVRKIRIVAIRRIYRDRGRYGGWPGLRLRLRLRLRIRKSVPMVVITRVKEANPSTINIIWEEVNNRQRTLRVQGKARCSNKQNNNDCSDRNGCIVHLRDTSDLSADE